MPSAGYLIYSGVMPLLNMFVTIVFGFVVTYKDLFPPAASKGASQVTMNIALPALIFASIVPAFTPSNVSAIGPLALVALVYVVLGAVFGYIIREVCYVPRNFWQGIIVATTLSNWGNLPTAIVLSVTQQSPFDPKTDPALGVSFVSIFIMVYHIFFWVFGLAHSLSWDYLPEVPQGEEAETRVPWKQKPLGSFFAKTLLGYKPQPSSEKLEAPASASKSELDYTKDDTTVRGGEVLARRTSHLSVTSVRSRRPSSGTGAILPAFRNDGAPPATLTEVEEPVDAPIPSSPSFIVRFYRAVSVILTPITLTIVVALPISLVTPLKALFVDTASVGGPDWKGPDGKPPLAFVIDTCQFVGNIAVPMALILLGASFARMRIPRPISRLPIPAMLSVCTVKLAILPVIGIFMIQAMVKKGFIPKDAKAELFVAMFLSGTPSAVNQLIVSGLYSPTGDLDTLSAFLLAQYIFMFFSSAALTAVSLLLI